MGPVEIVVIALLAGAPLAAIGFVVFKARRAEHPEAFSTAHGVPLTDANRALIAAYLDRSWKWRLTGAFLGAVIPFRTRIPGLEMLGGYLAGALVAELTDHRLRATAQRAAVLTPRSLGDYLAPGLLRALRATALLGVTLAPAFVLLPRRGPVGGYPQVFVAAGLVVVTAVVVEVFVRIIVSRPQPADEADLVETDDAIRSASVHATAGAGLALVLLLLAAELWVFGYGTDVQVLRWGGPVLSLTASAAAFATWSVFGHDRRWRVRRSTPGEVAR